jgi:hypothetical protein
MPSQYETDYHQWAIDTANALRAGRFEEIDIEAAAEEIEDLAKSQRRALRSAIVQLFLHLLNSTYQPNRSTPSWQISIRKQRRKIDRILRENPSLAPLTADTSFLADAYDDAVLDAVAQTGLPEGTFPVECPFTPEDSKG